MIASSASAAGSPSGLAAWRSGTAPAGGADAPSPGAQGARIGLPPPLLNPSLRFDSEAGVVVLEFFDKSGEVARTIPPERVLQAYARERDEARVEPTLLETAS